MPGNEILRYQNKIQILKTKQAFSNYIDVIDVANFRLTGFNLIGKALVKVSYLQNLRARLSMFRTELVEGAERRGEWADASWG